jgi:hypothetical protein
MKKTNSFLSMLFSFFALGSSVLSFVPYACFVFIVAAVTFIALSKSKRERHLSTGDVDNKETNIGRIISTTAIPVLLGFAILGIYITANFSKIFA